MITGFILLLGGIGTLILARIVGNRLSKAFQNGLPADGVIFDFEDDGRRLYPVVRFLTLQNEWITARSNTSYPGGIFKKGQQVTLVYDPAEPNKYYINSKWTKVTPTILTFTAVVLIIIAVFAFLGKIPVQFN